MGRGYSATGGRRADKNGSTTAISAPRLSGTESFPEIQEFVASNTGYKFDKSMEKCDREVLIANANKLAELQVEYGDPNGGNRKPVIKYNGRLKTTMARVFEDSGVIEVGNDYSNASSLIRVSNRCAFPRHIIDDSPASFWNLPANAPREAVITYTLAHELSHSYMTKKIKELHNGHAAESSYSGEWNKVIKIARAKYGYKGTANTNCKYPTLYKKNSPDFSAEAFAEAMAGYMAGRRDAISQAANEWLRN